MIPMDFSLTDQEKLILLHTARETISARLMRRKPEYREPTPALKTPCGAFVTLHKRGALRGCIGHISAVDPLMETVKQMAFASAFEDPRFPALSLSELEQIDIEISVLSPLERIKNVEEIAVGKHGLYLKKGRASGLLLPQVATEQGWDRDTFLTHTCYKAGLPGDAWKSPDTEILIFSALVFGEKQFLHG